MKIVINHTLRSIRAHVGQPIVITVTIAVVTFLLFVALSLNNVFYNFQLANLSRVASDADVSISGEIFSGNKLDEFLSAKDGEIEYVSRFLNMTGLETEFR